MSRFAFAWIAVVFIEVVVIGCSSTETARQREPELSPAVSVTPGPGRLAHSVQDMRLRKVMDQISLRNSQTAPPADMPQDPEEPINRSTEWYFGEAQTLATDLAATAQRIPHSVNLTKMNDADRAGFEAEALTLRAQALRLRDAASGHKVEQMQRVLDGINSTCISCHSRYRDFSGELRSQ